MVERGARRTRLDEYVARGGNRPDHYSDVPVEHARIEFVNVVTWARTLRSRLDQPDRNGKRLGLLPAMNPAHPATADVRRLIKRVDKEALADASRLAGFGLHVSVWPYPRAGVPVDPEGRLLLRVPDPVPGRVYSPWLFTYEGQREA